MKIKPKKFVNFVSRQPHWLSNRKGYYTMERNERVDEFSKTLINKIRKQFLYKMPIANTSILFRRVQ